MKLMPHYAPTCLGKRFTFFISYKMTVEFCWTDVRCACADESDAGASVEHQLHRRVVAADRTEQRRNPRLQYLLGRTVSYNSAQRRPHQGAAREARPFQGCFAVAGAGHCFIFV